MGLKQENSLKQASAAALSQGPRGIHPQLNEVRSIDSLRCGRPQTMGNPSLLRKKKKDFFIGFGLVLGDFGKCLRRQELALDLMLLGSEVILRLPILMTLIQEVGKVESGLAVIGKKKKKVTVIHFSQCRGMFDHFAGDGWFGCCFFVFVCAQT